MPTRKITAAHLSTLSFTVSDLLVGLECVDAPEVVHEARILEKLADECAVSPLGMTALKIELAATVGDLDAVQSIIPELKEHLQQALEDLDMQIQSEVDHAVPET